MDINNFIQIFSSFIAIISTLILWITIRNNRIFQQNNLLNEIIKQERELRIKLNEYREQIHKRMDLSKDFLEITLDYDTLLFNYYEYLAICVYKRSIDRNCAKIYFRTLLKNMKELFNSSILFEEGYSQKEEYLGIQWLFKHWNID